MRWLVVGAGFRGIVGAYLLASQGHEVTLRDGANTLGGVLNSSPWKGFYLDKGCHLFSHSGDRAAEVLLDLQVNDTAPVAVRYASVTNARKTDGLAIPNLESHGRYTANAIRCELLQAVAEPARPCTNLKQALGARFGPTAAGLLASIAHKIYRAVPESLDACGFPLTPFRRIKFLPDLEAEALKADPVLDDRVASALRAGAKRHFYPGRHGLRGFCDRAEERLKQLGVTLELGRPLENLDDVDAHCVLWTSGLPALEKLGTGGDTVARHVHHVPMVLHYFVIEKSAEGPYTYLQDFDLDDYVFRTSVPGNYAPHSCPEGLSYVCCEVPTTLDSPEWRDPAAFAERAWAEVRRHGVVTSAQPIESLSVKTPTSYWMPRVGYTQAAAKLGDFLAAKASLQCMDELVFSKNEIVRAMLEGLHA
jgi:hypothetical protein